MSTLSKGNDTADVPLTFSSTVRNLSTTGPSSLTATVGGTALEEEQQQNWNKSQDSSTQTTRVNYSLKSFSLSLTSGFTVWIAKLQKVAAFRQYIFVQSRPSGHFRRRKGTHLKY